MNKYSILVVDDEELLRTSLAFDLGKEGYEVSLAESGDKAIELLKNHEYDLIITDLMMEGADGIELLKSAKEKNKESMVIVLTGYGSMETAIDALQLDAADYMLKPYNKKEMLLRVVNCLNKLDLSRREQKLQKELVNSYEDLKIIEDSRDTFFHWIVHDLKGPLSSLLNAMQLLDDGSVSNDKEFTTTLIKSMQKSIVTMLSLIADILDVSSLEANEMPVSLKTINVSEFAKDFFDQSKLQTDAPNRKLVFDCKVNNIEAVTDTKLLYRVMQNIYSNALKYGSNNAEIGFYVDQNGEYATLSIANEGTLIPDEFKTRIFEKYFQTENNKLKKSGNGIGLAFCKLAVEAMDGKIWVEDTKNNGTNFKIALKKTAVTSNQ